jgi:hypothetical protein
LIDAAAKIGVNRATTGALNRLFQAAVGYPSPAHTASSIWF